MRIVILYMMSILVCALSESDQHTKFRLPYDKTLIAKACHGSIPNSLDVRNNLSPHFLYSLCVKASIDDITKTSIKFLNKDMLSKQLQENLPVETCQEFLSLALHNLNMSLPSTAGALTDPKARADFMTWLSAAIADVHTCRDAFQSVILTKDLDEPVKLITTSLSILNGIDNYTSLRERSSSYKVNLGQRTADWAPTWLSDEDKMLLQGSRGKATDASTIVVAADGSGNYKTIREAIAAVPSRKDERFVIHVKQGVYHENVKVPEDKWNVKIYGDGMGKTIVSSNLHADSQTQLRSTATFAIYGKGFIAMDIEFQNTAGPSKGQAIALLSASDQSVFCRCRIAGYQDTLWTHSNRQFYRECQILGTVDFIFGDAAAVIQNSDILVRRPQSGGRTYITAQGKENPQSKTGFSIQNCTIAGAEDLRGIKTYLGRPWESHSTTVIMESQLGDIISPEGWSAFGGSAPSTIDYVEYNNRGPGAVTEKRVKWPGLKLGNTREDASKFTVRSFINGDVWLPSSTVPFKADL